MVTTNKKDSHESPFVRMTPLLVIDDIFVGLRGDEVVCCVDCTVLVYNTIELLIVLVYKNEVMNE